MNSPGVSFVVFFKNLTNQPIHTVKNLKIAMSEISAVDFEIILVRDGGERDYLVKEFVTTTCLQDNFKYIELSDSVGVAGVFEKVIDCVKFSHTCVVPGNNPFTAESFKNIVRDFQTRDAVLGYRKNLLHARPYPKIVASFCLTRLVKLTFYPSLNFIKDFHGLNLFRSELVHRYAKLSRGHGIQISLIIPIHFSKGSIIQVPVYNNLMRGGVHGSSFKFPKLKHIAFVISDLIRLKRTFHR